MTSKNNQAERLAKRMPLTQRFALRKLSVGVASVLLGTGIAMGLNGKVAHADVSNGQAAPVDTSSSALTSTSTSTSNLTTLSASKAADNTQAAAPAVSDEVKATAPIDDTAYTVTNVNASSEQGNGTDRTGQTNLSFDLNLDIANHDIKAGDYLNVSMGIPYQLTANGQPYTLSYGGTASQQMPINITYQTTTGQNFTSVIGYMHPVTGKGDRSYAISYHKSPISDPQNVDWQAATNNNGLGSNGNGGSNDSYQIIFNDELEKIKAAYGNANLSLAKIHFDLTWHNITGFDLNEAPLDTRYFHLYSSTATQSAFLEPQNDIQIGDQHFTSGFKIPVEAKGELKDNLNQDISPESESEYAAHTWYYDLQTQKWFYGFEPLRYPDHVEAVGLANQNKAGTKLGNSFTITVTKPAPNDYVNYQFISDSDVKDALEKSIVVNAEIYNLDPVTGAPDTYVTREMISAFYPAIDVRSTDSPDGLTRVYQITIEGDYQGFRKDRGIGLIRWVPKDLNGVLPPANITSPNDDPMETKNYYDGVTLQNTGLQTFLEDHPWKITITNNQGQELLNQDAGYYLPLYIYRDSVTSNSGLLTGTINNVNNQQVHETIHYVYQDTGKEAAPTYTATLGFAQINENGTWQAWTPTSDTFKKVVIPEIAGFRAVDQDGKAVNAIDTMVVSHNSPDIDITIYYVPAWNRLQTDTKKVTRTISYYDKNTGEPLPVTDAAPVKQIVTFTRQAIIDGLTNKVVGYTFDGKKDNNGNYIIEETVADKAWKKDSGDWAASVNPVLTFQGYDLAENEQGQLYPKVAADTPTALSKDQQIKVYYPEKVTTTDEQALITRTINYVYGNGPHQGTSAAPQQSQQVTFTRQKSVNLVTKVTKYGDWSTNNDRFAAVNSPAIDYYVADQEVVPALQVKPDDSNVSVTVNYTTTPNDVTYSVIDDTNGKTLVNHQLLTSGFADEQLPADTIDAYEAVIKHYQDLGYTIVSQDKLPTLFKHENQNVVVHVLLQNSLQPEWQTTTRTITYYDRSTGKQIMIDGVTEPVMQRAVFVRQGIVDADHQLLGYTLNGKKDNNGNYIVEIPLGDADEAWQLAGGGWPASPNPDLQKYGYNAPEDEEGEPYPMVSAGHPTALVPNQSIKVYYQPRIESSNEQSQAMRIIHYVYANGPQKGKMAAPDVQQVVTWSREDQTNEVTKAVTSGDWQPLKSETIVNGKTVLENDSTSFAAVDSPLIKGYTPDQAVVADLLAMRGSQPIEVTVNYTTEPHQITYSVIDDTTNLTLINHAQLGTGYAGESLPLAMDKNYQDVDTHYQQLGYKVVSQEPLPTTFADHDLNVVIHLVHGTKSVSGQRTVNEDIQYQFIDGGIAAPTYHATPITFTRNGVTDLVTGNTSWQAWKPVNDYFTPVDSPIIDGYTTATPKIGEQMVTADSQDLHFIVLYSKVKVPVTPQPTPEKPVTPQPVPEKPTTPHTPGSTPTVPSTSPTSGVTNHETNPTKVQPSTSSRADSISTPAVSEKPMHTANASAQKLPQTGNQHQGFWQTVLGIFLGLFGISFGKRRKKTN
ncbi:mucin-binding protein [Limosilactobacillus agrestis]|uniref:mucin-binding protein n=1 Tax=Limosilactobacillus agrestis TaxID=2759748 RepID=UPI001E2969E0|nr:YSIRK-type signal peptide-containing protein [Limosilactobacillus agrestis]MCD7113226.1 YSIRK-type signal peptide-containing protein [Limosilactobacillus agrestis]